MEAPPAHMRLPLLIPAARCVRTQAPMAVCLAAFVTGLAAQVGTQRCLRLQSRHCSRAAAAEWGAGPLARSPARPPRLQMALMSLVCTYAGSIVGFVSGVVGSLQATVQLGGVLVRVGGLGARALAGAAVRGAAAAGGLGAPVVMALLKTLALSRLFA